MKTMLVVLFSLIVSNFASAEKLCGVVRVDHGPALATVEPAYSVEVKDPEQGPLTVISLSGDNTRILRRLQDGVSYCLEGHYEINCPNNTRIFCVSEFAIVS